MVRKLVGSALGTSVLLLALAVLLPVSTSPALASVQQQAGDAVNLLDTKAPTGTVRINGGDEYTTRWSVKVEVPATDSGSGMDRVRLSNSPKMSGNQLALHRTYDYVTPITWDLHDEAAGGSTKEGTRTVYVQWADKAGNWSEVVSDTIVIQTGSEEGKFLAVINQYRLQNGLLILKLSPKMTRAARWMSADMGANRYFSHTDSLSRDPFERMGAFGYGYNTYKAENIASGYELAQYVFDAWIKSPAHKKNIDNPNYRAIGIGRVYTKGSPYGWYWTNDFGAVMDTSTSIALSNQLSVSGGFYQYNKYRDVRVSGQVVGNFATMVVSVEVQKQDYDSTKGAYVWKAHEIRNATLDSDSRYRVSLTPGNGKYRVRAVFPGKGDIKASSSSYIQFQMQEGQVSGVSYVPKSDRQTLGGEAVVAGLELARLVLGWYNPHPK